MEVGFGNACDLYVFSAATEHTVYLEQCEQTQVVLALHCTGPCAGIREHFPRTYGVRQTPCTIGAGQTHASIKALHTHDLPLKA